MSHHRHVDDHLPPLPSVEFPVFGLAEGRPGWRSLVEWRSPGSFHQIILAHGGGSPPADGQRHVAGLITVITNRKGLAELDPDTGQGRPETELRHVMSNAFVGLADRVTRAWTGSERARRSWMNQFHASNTSDTDDWLPTTLDVDGQRVPGLARNAHGQTAVIAELDAVFLTAEWEESTLDELQLVEVTAHINTYIAGRAALTAAKSGHEL